MPYDISKHGWKPGVSGNPGGLSKEIHRINKRFLRDIRQMWEKEGDSCLKRMVRDDPSAFVKLMAATLPKNVHIDQSVDVAVTWVQAIQAMPPIDAQGHIDYTHRDQPAIEGEVVQEGDAVQGEQKQ